MARPENSPRGDCQRLGQSETAGLRLVSINDGRLAIAHSSRLGTHRQCSERRFRMFRGLQHSARRSNRPKPAFRKVIMDGDRRSDGRYLEISESSCAEGATLDWRWPLTYGSGPFALATPCTHVPGRYSGPSKFKSRVAHPWSWDIGSSTSAAQTSLNMVLSRRKARPFGLSTKLGLQENGRPSPKGTALWPGPCSMD